MRPRATRFGWFFRGGLVVLAFALAVYAFSVGVGVTDRANVERADLLTHVYYALGLFVLGGLDLGLPTGGPVGARTMLWLAYFLAPSITTSAVIEGAVRLLRPTWLRRLMFRDHFVVVGAGHLGILYIDTLVQAHPRARIVVVDRDAMRSSIDVIRRQYNASFVAGDIRAAATLDALSLSRAVSVALVTDDDLVNLEVAWRVAQLAPKAKIIAHVADLGLRRMVTKVESQANRRVRVFNSHRIAAQRLYQHHLREEFARTAAEDIVVIAGFGRFGQTIFEYLLREAKGEIQRAIVVDASARRLVRLFRAQVPGYESCDIVTIEGNLDDPHTWAEVEEASSGRGVDPVYVLGTDDDQMNLRTAIALRSLHPSAKLYVRCVFESAFTHEMAEELCFTALAVEGTLREALTQRHQEWLETSSETPRSSWMPAE